MKPWLVTITHYEVCLKEQIAMGSNVRDCRNRLESLVNKFPQRPLRIFIEAAGGADKHVFEEEIA